MLDFRTAALYAAATIAALAVLIPAAWHAPARAEGGESARSQAPAPDQSGDAIKQYALRILRALSDDANHWVRYWQATAACDAAPPAPRADAPPSARALLALTAAMCAQLDALFGVNPADHSPRGEDRTVGLLLSEPDAAAGYTLFIGRLDADIFLIDPLGRVAHAWHMDDAAFNHAKLLDNGNLLATKPGSVSEVDPRGNIVWRYESVRLHHDFLKMPNGNVLLLDKQIKTREQVIAAGANPDFVSEGRVGYDRLVEVRPAGASGGKVVWEWSAWDHLIQDFDPTKPNYGAIAEHPELIDINFRLDAIGARRQQAPLDWLHSNAIDYNPELDQIMLSPRHFSELWIIDHSPTTEEARGNSGGNGGMGGDLLYRWGNPRAYGQGDAADQRLFWQHQPHWIPPGLPSAGNILLFNNGNEFPDYRRYYSSIDEIVPPVDGYHYRRADDAAYPPDAPAWTYAAETPADFYAPILSGAQRLPNGNTLIVDGTAGTMSQTTPDGRIVWRYVVPLNKRIHLRQGERPSIRETFPTPHGDPAPWLNNDLYRAYWYPPDHPGLRALDLTPGAFIEDIPDIYDLARAAAINGDFDAPIARSYFDIYLDNKDADEDNRRLIYIKRPCAAEDAQPKFFLHITPADARDLPAHRQEHGFDNLDFNFNGNDVKASDGRCVAIAALPNYAIERISAGQHSDAGAIWQTDINLNE